MPNETSPILFAKTPASQQAEPSDAEQDARRDGRHDFDFLVGRWRVEHRRLRERLVGCTEWDTFIGETECRHINGAFDQGRGTFTAKDVLNGQPIEIRFTWDEMTDTTARWHQAFSADSGTTWEPNWFMHFRRAQH